MLGALETHKDKNSVNIFSITSRCALTMVLSTSFGLTASEVHFDDEILKAVEEWVTIAKMCEKWLSNFSF